ncbi:hypothetical protein AGMMS50212_13610 [Spirochaetia bacterium]|nr:hypothetical protein AGMMS50212_13610 [Spirochaetia bacterium]
MALKGLDYYKFTPKTNCGECGCPTCMAFGMKIAQGGTTIDKCPYIKQSDLAELKKFGLQKSELDPLKIKLRIVWLFLASYGWDTKTNNISDECDKQFVYLKHELGVYDDTSSLEASCRQYIAIWDENNFKVDIICNEINRYIKTLPVLDSLQIIILLISLANADESYSTIKTKNLRKILRLCSSDEFLSDITDSAETFIALTEYKTWIETNVGSDWANSQIKATLLAELEKNQNDMIESFNDLVAL